MNEEREKLKLEILKLDLGNCDRGYNQVINFILEDRKRICAPLVKLQDTRIPIGEKNEYAIKAIYATLKLAGLEDGK